MLKINKVLIISSGLLTVEKPPASLGFLAGVCSNNNINYEIFDLNIYLKKALGESLWNRAYALLPGLGNTENIEVLNKVIVSIELAVEEIACFENIDLIALTVFSWQQILITRIFLEKIRAKLNLVIIAGGPGISYEIEPNKTAGKLFLENKLVDYYVLGEGEYVLESFFRGYKELGLNYDQVSETWAPQIDNLDDCVIPTYQKIIFDDYEPGINVDHRISITGSRGCVRRCTFCDVGHIWKKFRFRSANNVVTEILQHINETGIKQFIFTDSLINGSIKQFSDLMIRIVELKSQGILPEDLKYIGQFIVRPKSQFGEKYFQLMQESGCHNIQIGIESGSDRVRHHMGKKFSNDDIDFHLEMCSKYGIKNALLMMSGYPTETHEDHIATINMFKRYQKYLIDDTVVSVNLSQPYVLLKNTPMDDMRDELGIYNENYATHFFNIKTNPDLNIKERFRRYIELKMLLLDLKYPGSWADLSDLKEEIEHVKIFIKENQS
jgi:radical SAM superfamily enzyme YgiQ (UPF0313 family)